ncbi:MAG: LysR family transcriptional regulator [Actinobacteria bacterium]|nr:LysR family transcriptional regulator [Actinomycetota bacterium]MBI3688606.1 LysR family transcriptional regulator [Actinomycetota bacterium]
MTEARLRALVTVADTGSVRAAAVRLVVTESAVSAAVSALGRDLGVPLLARAGRGLRLTTAGETYLSYARRVLGLLEEGRAAARGELDPGLGRLRLAAVTTAGEQLLPATLASFHRRWPDVELVLEVCPSARVWHLLSMYEVDLVLAGRPPADAAVTVLATRANELVAVAEPGLASRFRLAGTPWLLREPGSGTRATVEAYLAEQEADPPRLVLGSTGAVVAGAIAGLGVALVSRDGVRADLAAGRLVPVPAPGLPLRRPWHAVAGPTPTGTTRLFVDHLLAEDGRPRWRRVRLGAAAR